MKKGFAFGHLRSAILLAVLFSLFSGAFGQMQVRDEIRIPDIMGFQTLKCDFHMHTIFSDGNVWPHIRAEEAWREGLDCFSITDHIEYLPHEKDVKKDHNRSFELAKGHAHALDLIIVPGGEITRKIPPGHLNVIFVPDVSSLEKEDWNEAIAAGVGQGGFCFFNHPGWYHTDNISRWYEEHDLLLEEGFLHGVEVVNGSAYYPEAHRWCLEKGLTMIGTSDVHNPINLDYDFKGGDHRPVTLVFAENRDANSVREALFARRTAIYYKDILIGEKKYLEAIFRAGTRIHPQPYPIHGKGSAALQIYNDTCVPFRLVFHDQDDRIYVPEKAVLYPGKTVRFAVRSKSPDLDGTLSFSLPVEITNLLAQPERGLQTTLDLELEFIAAD